jgi:hypothetical protein
MERDSSLSSLNHVQASVPTNHLLMMAPKFAPTAKTSMERPALQADHSAAQTVLVLPVRGHAAVIIQANVLQDTAVLGRPVCQDQVRINMRGVCIM